MIKEFEFFHGLVFARILHATQRPLSIEPFPSPSNSSYIVNGDVGLYIKYSSKRMTPWRFSFKREHQEEIVEMKKKFDQVFLVLVCNDDGIVCLSYEEIRQILDEQIEPVEWVSASRNPRQMYAIKGSNGKLGFKIADNEFPSKLFDKRKPEKAIDIIKWFKK
jgi:hypothetical protein